MDRHTLKGLEHQAGLSRPASPHLSLSRSWRGLVRCSGLDLPSWIRRGRR